MQKYKYTRLYTMIIGAIFISFLSSVYAYAAIEEDKSAAVIFVYQRVGEDSVPQSNVSVEQFQEHIQELKKGGYTVLPVPSIVKALKNGDKLPRKTVGITFEGAYQTTLSNAVPLLEEAQMPFTIFFASDRIDGNSPGHLTWDQIKKLRKNKLASFGIMPAAYAHMVTQSIEENAAIINRAISRYREMLGEDPAFFSYPYGEFNNALKKQLSGYNFDAVFGQQSSAMYAQSDFLALPRFTMTDEYGDLDRFTLTANALPLPVADIVPEDTVLSQNPPLIGFTITPEINNLSKLSCFASSLGKLPLMRVGGNRIEIRPAHPFVDRRTRINCTLPNETIIPGEPLAWRWFGLMLVSPTQDEDAVDNAQTDNIDTVPEDPENQ